MYLTGRVIEEGQRVPDYHGFTYYDFDRDVTIYHLIPINIIVAVYRHIWIWFKWRVFDSFRGKQYKWAIKAAYDEGYSKGFLAGEAYVVNQLKE